MLSDPVVCVGGLGGSGTKVVSQIFQRIGIFFGEDQNGSADTLPFTLFFNISAFSLSEKDFKHRAELFARCMLGCRISEDEVGEVLSLVADNQLQQPNSWMRERALRATSSVRKPVTAAWGWKSPPTHFFADRFLMFWHGLKFVFVFRDAFDMALSKNQNQLKYWSPHIYGVKGCLERGDMGALEFWFRVHERILELKRRLPERVLIVPYERLCESPVNAVRSLVDSVRGRSCNVEFSELFKIPRSNETSGRGRVLRSRCPATLTTSLDTLARELNDCAF